MARHIRADGGAKRKKENMPNIPSLTELLEAGVHFGHKSTKWHPKMEPYIFTQRNGVHILNLEDTRAKLKEALEFVTSGVAKGAVVLFLGTKKQAQSIVEEAARACMAPYITEKWIGGLITNFVEIKRSIKKYQTLKKEKETGGWEKYVKKERIAREKELKKLESRLYGIATLERIPDILLVFDMRGDKTAAREANRKGVKVVGICDTNVDPTLANYIVPANDDAVKSIALLANLFKDAVLEGKKEYELVLAEKGAADAAEKLAKKPAPQEKAEVIASA